MRESRRDAKGPQSTSDAKSENQDTGTSPPSFVRGTQREYSSKPLKLSIVKRILEFERYI